MLDEIENQEDKKKRDLTSYSNQRTFLITMVAHLAVFLFTTFMVYSCVPGASKSVLSSLSDYHTDVHFVFISFLNCKFQGQSGTLLFSVIRCYVIDLLLNQLFRIVDYFSWHPFLMTLAVSHYN